MSQSEWAYPVNNWSDLIGAIVASEQAGAIGQAHLLRALAAGRIAFLPLRPDTSSSNFKAFLRGTARRPAVALIGDDDGMDRGPPAWRLAERAIRWARGIVLHGTGGEVEHYEAAIQGAEVAGRVLVVECGSATLAAWAALSAAAPHRPNVLVIRPPPGGTHPSAPPREAWQ